MQGVAISAEKSQQMVLAARSRGNPTRHDFWGYGDSFELRPR
jgi:hypothetical protein